MTSWEMIGCLFAGLWGMSIFLRVVGQEMIAHKKQLEYAEWLEQERARRAIMEVPVAKVANYRIPTIPGMGAVKPAN